MNNDILINGCVRLLDGSIDCYHAAKTYLAEDSSETEIDNKNKEFIAEYKKMLPMIEKRQVRIAGQDEIISNTKRKYSELEIFSFVIQEAEARKYLTSGKEDKTSIIYALAKTRNVDLKTFAAKVLEKASAYKQVIIKGLLES